jgi:sporulation protein YlmC with PRC-barrel domain
MTTLSNPHPTLDRPDGAKIVGDRGSDHSGPGPEVMGASTLKGDSVLNASGDDLGHIEEIMLDVGRGQIAYAVLSFGGFLGMGSKLFAVPWSALILDADRECFVLDIPKERLETAPGFDKDQWPSMADPRWQSEIDRYYGARPYWE